jgi:hypothetical protein
MALIWNKKDFVLKAAKTPNLYFKFGDEVPENELGEGMKEVRLKNGSLIEKKADAPKAAPKPEPEPEPMPVLKAKPSPLPEKTESKPKPKKKGRK